MRSTSIAARFATLVAGALILHAGAATSRARPDGALTAVVDGKETPAPNIKMGDPAVVAKIIDEGKNRSQVMKHLEYLTKKIGPRLTGSANAETANRWCADQYKAWGLKNIQVEEWGTIPVRFDRGPSTGKVFTQNGSAWESARDLQFTTMCWAAGTNGPVRGPVIKMPANEDEYKAVKDKLKGAWVLIPVPGEGESGARRGGAAMARYNSAIEARKKVTEEKADPATLSWEDRMLFDSINGFISSSRSDRVLTGGAPRWREMDATKINPDVFVTICQSDYEFLTKAMEESKAFQVEFNLQNKFTAGPISCYNTIAEIPGTVWPDQVVIVSGHLDSWNGPGSEGAVDNGTGSATTLEAARILAAVGAKPKRTIRFIDWTGEEQGLLGSRGYVDKHKDDIVKSVSCCLVDDGGTNYDGGLPAAEQMVPMLAAATAPINGVFYSEVDQKFLNVNIRNTGKKIDTHGASDHASFNRVGVPGFFWDETGRSDYNHMHHTQFDTYETAIPEYLVQSATCAAVTAYNLACADEMLPRVIPDAPKDAAAPEKPKPVADAPAAPKAKRITP